MDNNKIGNLIAKLRKSKGLTQQELGDMVGIGFRAVSKWERGITMPDISIINDLSKILGITSDELLSGEIKQTNNSKENKKSSKTIKITISILTIIILVITSITIYLNNKTYVYKLKKLDGEDYYIDGQITFKGKNMSVIVNKVMFLDETIASTKVKDYDYEIYSGKDYIYGYGYDPNAENIDNIFVIGELLENFRSNNNINISLKRQDIVSNGVMLIFNFLDTNNNVITKKIQCTLY